MAIDRSLLSGSNGMLLLKLLEEKDLYGYEMIEMLRERSMNVFELKAGTLYPILHKLEEQRCVETYEKEVAGKVRKYYRITKEGKKQLKAKTEEWNEYSKAVSQVLGEMCIRDRTWERRCCRRESKRL